MSRRFYRGDRVTRVADGLTGYVTGLGNDGSIWVVFGDQLPVQCAAASLVFAKAVQS